VLLADDYKGWADENDIIKPVIEGAAELVLKKVRLARVVGPTMSALKGILCASIF